MSADGTQRGPAGLLARRKHQVVSGALAGLALASVAAMLVPRTYRCETRLEAQGAVGSVAADRVQSVREQILSSKTFDAVAGDLGLVVAAASPAERAAAVEARLRATEVTADGSGEGRFRIAVAHVADDPDTAFQVVRRIADLYQQDVNETPRRDQEKVVAEARAAESAAATASADAAKVRDEFRAANADLLDGTEERLAKVREEMRTLETVELARLKAEVERLDALLREEQPMKKTVRKDVDRVRAAQIEQRIADAQAALAAAEAGSPEAKAADEAVAAAREERRVLEAEARSVEEVVANPLHAEYQAKHLEATSALGIADIKLREMRKTERDLQSRVKQAVPVRARLVELDAAVAGTASAHESRRTGLAAAEARLAEIERDQGLSFTVVEPPLRPDAPAGPGPVLYALGGLVLGAGIGLAAAAALDRADRSLRDVDVAADVLGVPSLGAIDRIVTAADAAADRAMRLRRAVAVGALAAVALGCAGVAVADGGSAALGAVRSVMR